MIINLAYPYIRLEDMDIDSIRIDPMFVIWI